MVLNEGDRPVSQEDVWMRDREGRMDTEERSRRRNTADVLVDGDNLTWTEIPSPS
jgi:hypothetical protein